jgi:hypothetical protein
MAVKATLGQKRSDLFFEKLELVGGRRSSDGASAGEQDRPRDEVAGNHGFFQEATRQRGG